MYYIGNDDILVKFYDYDVDCIDKTRIKLKGINKWFPISDFSNNDQENFVIDNIDDNEKEILHKLNTLSKIYYEKLTINGVKKNDIIKQYNELKFKKVEKEYYKKLSDKIHLISYMFKDGSLIVESYYTLNETKYYNAYYY